MTDELNYTNKVVQSNVYSESLVRKLINGTLLLNNKKSQKKEKFETPKLFMSYEKWSSEQVKPIVNRYGIEVIFRRNLSLKSRFLVTLLKVETFAV